MIIGEEYKPFNLFFGAVMPNWLMKRTEINGNDKMIFSRLCQYAGKNGKAFPKRETLAEEVGLKENTVRKILIKLEDNGLIKIKPKKMVFQQSIFSLGINGLTLDSKMQT